MKPRTRLKWDKFLCWLLGHKWHDVYEKDLSLLGVGTWRVCLRCAEAEYQEPAPAELPMCQCGLISNEDFLAADWEPLEPSKKDLEFIEFHKTTKKQITGGKGGKDKRD